MGDMTGPDLAKVLYSWAMLEWHPEPELLADVKASFVAAAAGGGLQQHNSQQQQEQEQQAAGGQQQQQPQQWAELQVWQGPWMAAGLWGLCKLGEPCEGQVLSLLAQHWPQLLAYWTPQQMADIAGALSLTADQEVAAAAVTSTAHVQDGQLEQQLSDLVLGLSGQVLGLLGEVAVEEAQAAVEPRVPLPWPESMLMQLQASLLNASVPASQRAAAAASDIAAAGTGTGRAAAEGVPMMVVQNVPQLAWRMLQALAAVGVNVSEPEDQATGSLVAALSAATKVPSSLETRTA